MNDLLHTLTFYINDILKTFQQQKGESLVVFMAVLSVSYSFLVVIDFIPEKPTSDSTSSSATNIAEAAGYNNTDEDIVVIADTENNEIEAVSTSTADTELPLTIDSSTDSQDSQSTVQNTMQNNQLDRESTTSVEYSLPVEIHIDRLDRTIPVLNPVSRAIDDLDAALLNGAVRHPDSADFEREGNIFILGHSSRLPNVMNRNFQIFNSIENLKWGDVIRVRSYDMEYIYRVDRVYEAKASQVTIPIAGTGPRLTLVTCDNLGAIEDRFILEATLHSQRSL